MSEWWVSQYDPSPPKKTPQKSHHDHQSQSPQAHSPQKRPEISAPESKTIFSASASSLPSWPAINAKEMLHLTCQGNIRIDWWFFCYTITTYASQSATHLLCGPTALLYWFCNWQDMTQMTPRFIVQILSSFGIRFRPLGFPAVNITPKMKVQLENPCHGCPSLNNLKKPNSNRATKKRKTSYLLNFHYTGCLIGIPMMVFCNPPITC